MARELLFFSQTDSKGYPGYLMRKTVPEGVFPEWIEIDFDPGNLGENWRQERGWRSDGVNIDRGPHNGPHCMPSMELFCHKMSWALIVRIGRVLDCA